MRCTTREFTTYDAQCPQGPGTWCKYRAGDRERPHHQLLTQEELHALLDYVHSKGIFDHRQVAKGVTVEVEGCNALIGKTVLKSSGWTRHYPQMVRLALAIWNSDVGMWGFLLNWSKADGYSVASLTYNAEAEAKDRLATQKASPTRKRKSDHRPGPKAKPKPRPVAFTLPIPGTNAQPKPKPKPQPKAAPPSREFCANLIGLY